MNRPHIWSIWDECKACLMPMYFWVDNGEPPCPGRTVPCDHVYVKFAMDICPDCGASGEQVHEEYLAKSASGCDQ